MECQPIYTIKIQMIETALRHVSYSFYIANIISDVPWPSYWDIAYLLVVDKQRNFHLHTAVSLLSSHIWGKHYQVKEPLCIGPSQPAILCYSARQWLCVLGSKMSARLARANSPFALSLLLLWLMELMNCIEVKIQWENTLVQRYVTVSFVGML